MTGVTLSRWTMSYFAAALAALIAAECLMAAGYGYPAAAIGAPETLVLVHIVALGWLSLLMCGALFQFVPVMIAKPLYSNMLPLPTLACLLAGLAALLLGFLQLAGVVTQGAPLLAIGAVLLGLGFSLVLWNLGRTLWAARPLPLPSHFVIVGLCSIGATAIFGIVFAFVLSGVTAYPHLVDVATMGLPIHIIAGLGGWLTFTAIGVSYRLLAMFMLAPELKGPTTRGAFYAGASALALIIIGGATAICLHGSLTVILSIGGLLGLAAMALYGTDILHLYRARKRRKIELNSRMAAVALGNFAATAALIIILLVFGALERNIAAVVFFVAFGWLSGLGLSKLYKIVAFLTWLECYGPVLGKTATPRVQDLVVEHRAIRWFVLYFLGVWSATAALLLAQPSAFRVAVAVMLVATAGIIVQLVRTRRLADVQAALRLPAGVRQPRLLFSWNNLPERKPT
ncbi:MAG: hypothetical protein EPN75_12225 [Beijerinckiaceae bacterium]|nr:MAG: hypothetical protein EPN75_12225 [Beijerinckiaceae bacterium]